MTSRVATATPESGVEQGSIQITLGGAARESAITASQTSFQDGVTSRFVVTISGQIPHELILIPPIPSDGMDMEVMHHLALWEIHEDELLRCATQTLDVVFHAPAAMGTLDLACHLAGHYEAGMHLPIEVVP